MLRNRVQSVSEDDEDPAPNPYPTLLGNDYMENEEINLENAVYRPWAFNVPTLNEMLEDDWADRVKDWRMFWVMFEQWMYIHRGLNRKKPRSFSEEYLTWLGLHFYDRAELQFLLAKVNHASCRSLLLFLGSKL